MCSVLYMKNPWASFCFSYSLKAVISRKWSHTHKSLQCIADWTIVLNKPFKVRKSSRLKVNNDLSFMCNFTLVPYSYIFVFWNDCGTAIPQTPPMQQRVTHTWVHPHWKSHKLNCCTVYTYTERLCVRACICIYATTHIHIVYVDCCSPL